MSGLLSKTPSLAFGYHGFLPVPTPFVPLMFGLLSVGIVPALLSMVDRLVMAPQRIERLDSRLSGFVWEESSGVGMFVGDCGSFRQSKSS